MKLNFCWGRPLAPEARRHWSADSYSCTYGDCRKAEENKSDVCGLKGVGDDCAAAVSVDGQLPDGVVVIAIAHHVDVVVDARVRRVDITAAERHAGRVKRSVLFRLPVDRTPPPLQRSLPTPGVADAELHVGLISLNPNRPNIFAPTPNREPTELFTRTDPIHHLHTAIKVFNNR